MNGKVNQLTQELKGKIVNIELKNDSMLWNVKVLDCDAILLKVLYKYKGGGEIIYIPLCNIIRIDIREEEEVTESGESRFI